ncbi:MAG: hypothetical protein HY824_16895 [Acidobacteria bacterium]|nr:hypothetical protein [Acidobacteriota bacterium]
MRIPLLAAAVTALVCLLAPLEAQNGSGTPRVELRSSSMMELPGEVDSNSPALWDRVGGRNLLFVMTSISGRPSRAWGRDLTTLGAARQIALDPWPAGGIWMEAVVQDVDGTWYGYYHNEVPATMCRGSDKVVPRIGAARSKDRGATWEPLGVMLEAPPRQYDCATENAYFVGGVGDFSVQLDADSRDLYFFYSLYLRSPAAQGVGVARMAWADRDAPAGKIAIWRDGAWLPATAFGQQPRWIYPAASPVFHATGSWHATNSLVDEFWGPSVHWNTYLERYVMLLTRAKDDNFRNEGIYVSFAKTLDDPSRWSVPAKILNGGKWYPQVLGLDTGTGTDKVAGEWARFYMMGASEHLIHFIR